jgi:hypothetical protein
MITDPHTLYETNKTRINEYLEQAQKIRLAKEAAGSDNNFLASIRSMVSGWMQSMRPVSSARTAAAYSANVERKRSTAEIPSV